MQEVNHSVMLTHFQASGEKLEDKSEGYLRGYQRGWWLQPEEEPDNPDYVKGHDKGWLDRTLDRR